ncbi:alpha/beta fold hydrolase [Solirubrum puertoriconensis]|uniref:Arylesterase n=1 Tax=Solirubrum puertoriconensis TaxID=1751427 RepID=A0A9X0L3U4_SOLP1|nr:alpha/beta hydrolase [Solirubrum puertoriconensis]KUG06862.1 arylesterase [Solirubrum puertoriconensis]
MSYIQVGQDAQGNRVNIFYQDWGQGDPVVLIHGWPADHQMWEHQAHTLPHYGKRVIAYDRRGFGKSDKPWNGYDYDTLASDLNAILEGLNLQNVTLVGFSMGGGEVARYMSRYGGARVSKVVLVASVLPYLLKTDDNPDGVDKSTFDEIIDNLRKDRPDFLQTFGKQFYGVGVVSHPVSQATLDWMQMICLQATPHATEACAHAWAETDFRQDVQTIRVPTLIIHGTSDKTVPIESSSDQLTKLLPSATYIRYDGEPHGLFATADGKDRLTKDLLDFTGASGTPVSDDSRYSTAQQPLGSR